VVYIRTATPSYFGTTIGSNRLDGSLEKVSGRVVDDSEIKVSPRWLSESYLPMAFALVHPGMVSMVISDRKTGL
jgi:hypothetical protein